MSCSDKAIEIKIIIKKAKVVIILRSHALSKQSKIFYWLPKEVRFLTCESTPSFQKNMVKLVIFCINKSLLLEFRRGTGRRQKIFPSKTNTKRSSSLRKQASWH